jgi:hypothetical protein
MRVDGEYAVLRSYWPTPWGICPSHPWGEFTGESNVDSPVCLRRVPSLGGCRYHRPDVLIGKFAIVSRASAGSMNE